LGGRLRQISGSKKIDAQPVGSDGVNFFYGGLTKSKRMPKAGDGLTRKKRPMEVGGEIRQKMSHQKSYLAFTKHSEKIGGGRTAGRKKKCKGPRRIGSY